MNRSFSRLLLVFAVLPACSRPAPAPPAPTVVTVQTLQPRAAVVNLDYVGRIEAFNTAEIRPRVGGLLEAQLAVEGERVRKGQPLFRLDDRPLQAAAAQARAALAQAEAALARATRDLARAEPLTEVQAVSQQELDAARAAHDTARAAVAAAAAQLRGAELDLGYATVTSPIDGQLGRVQIRIGGLVTAFNALLATVYANDPMYVNFSISEQRMLELQGRLGADPNQYPRTASFTLQLADGQAYEHKATLDFVDPQVDARTGTLPVRLRVPNPEHRLVAGQFARVVVPAQQIEQALLLPQRAVQELQGRTFVYVLDADDQTVRRDVQMGARLGGDWLVLEGLQAGDRVVVEGAQKLRPGQRVQARPAAAG